MENSEVMETNGLNIAAPNVVAVSTEMTSDANVEMNACEGNNDLSANNLSPNDVPRNGVSGSGSAQLNLDSYAVRAARTVGYRDPPRRFSLPNSVTVDFGMPKRPKSAFFSPSRSASARSVFQALQSADISSSDIQCMQQKTNGEVVITFNHPRVKEKFLSLNSLSVNNENYAVQDIDKPLTFLTIYDAPFELSDLAIIKRLAPFCEVLNYRRGKFDFMPGVYNGLRHYHVRISKPIPSFLKFGKYQVFLKYDGQKPTCQKCNQPGHFSNECLTVFCFNCENLGHQAANCPAPVLCCICKEDGHIGVSCRYSWVSPTVHGCHTDESAAVNITAERSDDELSDVSCATRFQDSFRWADESDLSDIDSDANVDNLPLIAAIPVSSRPDVLLPFSPAADAEMSPSPVPDANLVELDPLPSDVSPVLDSQGFLKSNEPKIPVQPSSTCESSTVCSSPSVSTVAIPAVSPTTTSAVTDSTVLSTTTAVVPPVTTSDVTTSAVSSVSTPSVVPVAPKSRHGRAPAVIPDALAALGRIPTSPVLAQGKPRQRPAECPLSPEISIVSVSPAVAESEMDVSIDLKRKATISPRRKKEKKKKNVRK